jgi:hypothetical protein
MGKTTAKKKNPEEGALNVADFLENLLALFLNHLGALLACLLQLRNEQEHKGDNSGKNYYQLHGNLGPFAKKNAFHKKNLIGKE